MIIVGQFKIIRKCTGAQTPLTVSEKNIPDLFTCMGIL